MAVGKTSTAEVTYRKPTLSEIRLGRTMTIGRKRVVLPSSLDSPPHRSSPYSPVRKRPTRSVVPNRSDSEKSDLESLPEDILIRVLCSVDHDDLKQLVRVSKTISKAAVIAKQWHFAFSTPSKKLRGVRTFTEEDSSKFDNLEAPNAPRPPRTRMNGKKLEDIAVALFTSEESWPRKGLFSDTEI